MGKSITIAAICGSLLAAPAAIGQTPPGAALTERVESLQLLELARQTVALHPEILAAAAAVDASSAMRDAMARPLFNPEFALEFEDRVHETRVLAVNQTFDIAGRRTARTNAAGHDRDRAAAELAGVRRRIAGELLYLLGDYWTATSQDALAETRIDLMRAFAELTLQRRQAGDLTQVELNSANLAYAQAEVAHATAESALAAADQALRAVAPPPAPPAWPALPLDLQPVPGDPGMVERLLAELPELRARQAEVARARATVDLRVRERRPAPTVTFGAGEEDQEHYLALTFTMPLNIRNRYNHEIAAARAELSLFERAAENTRVRARHRMLAASERYRHTREAWLSWQRSGEPNQSQQAELLERLVQAGELSTTDYLVQLNQTLDAAMDALELRREFWRAWFEWLGASGQIDAWLGLDTGG